MISRSLFINLLQFYSFVIVIEIMSGLFAELQSKREEPVLQHHEARQRTTKKALLGSTLPGSGPVTAMPCCRYVVATGVTDYRVSKAEKEWL